MANTRGIDRLQEGNENLIFSDNFGGLNTTASDINVPYSDSPLLYNCDIDTAGNVTKRRGTRVLRNDATSFNRGFGWFNFITGGRNSVVVEKAGRDINIYSIDDSVVTLVLTKSDVWDTTAEEEYPSFARTSEFEPRVIITTGFNKPVQLSFIEANFFNLSGGVNIDNSDGRWQFADTTNTFGYVNGTLRTINNVVQIPGQTIIQFDVAPFPGDDVSVIYVSWQHWVEALFLQGKELVDRVTRNNAIPIDQNVAVPTTLSQQDIPSNYPTVPDSFGYAVYNSDVWDFDGSGTSLYTYVPGQNPSTEDEWASGNGSLYDSALGGTIIPSPLFITFGALQASGNPTELVIAKRFDLLTYFNGGEILNDDDIVVRVDGSLATQSTNGAAPTAGFGAYYLLDDTGVVTTQDTQFITFEASDRIGLNPESDVEIVNATTGSFIGTGAIADIDDYRDGAAVPIYGLGVFADYNKGDFPAYVEVFDNRIVLSGFRTNPLLVIFSENGDTTIPNRPYRKFQIRALDTLATDPIDFPISGVTEDYIRGMTIWQRSLFVFTRKSTHRIYGNDFNGISSSTIFSNLISNQGLTNERSIAKTEDAVLYLSDTGVQRIAFGGGDDDDYRTPEVSINIRREFGVTVINAYEDLSFMEYDSNLRKVYVGLPKEDEELFYSKRLFVYDTVRGSWTEYKTDGDFKLWDMLSYEDNVLGDRIIGFYSGFAGNKIFLKFEDDQYLDFIVSGIGVSSLTLPIFQHIATFTVTEDTYTYYIDEAPNANFFFDLIPNDDVNDLFVTLEGVTLTKGVDYVKHFYEGKRGSIELLSIPIPGDTLIVTKRTPVTDYEVTQAAYESQTNTPFNSPILDHKPYHVVLDNRYLVQDTDYVVNADTFNAVQITLNNTPDPNSNIYTGQYYEARYTSPLLSSGSLASIKRGKHVYAYFDNTGGQEQFRLSDVNSAANQPNDAIIGKYKQRLNANVELNFQNSDRSDVGTDIYSFYDLNYDFHIMDIDPSANQSKSYSLFKEALLGSGYAYKLAVWSFDEATFSLSAWQVTNRRGAQKFINSLI